MLLNFKIKNFKTFKNEIELSLSADMHIKKFAANTVNINNQNILKSIGIYGPNNTGKSCLIEAIYILRVLMLNEPHTEFNNSFYNNTITEVNATFESNGNFYQYIVKYDSINKLYLYEELKQLLPSNNNYLCSNTVFVRTSEKIDIKLPKINKLPIDLFNNSIPFLMILKLDNTEYEQAQNDYLDFARSIKVVSLEMPININRTLDLLKNDEKGRNFIISFAKNCDLNIEDFGYSNDNIISEVDINNKLSVLNDDVLMHSDILKIWSKHHGHTVPSILFDSLGTRKIISLASHIYDSLINGGILLIDELDSSLHHVIIRAIIAIYNNELNKKTQLIFSTHDALTMDLRRLFRKDQVYLTDIDEEGENKLIHLSKDFTSRCENGFRGDEDVVDYYLKGRFGAIPTPDLYDVVYEVLNDE